MTDTAAAFVTSTIAGIGSVLGVALVLWKEAWVRRWSLAAVALAAGAMATTALVHLVPEAVGIHEGGAYWTLAGFALFFLLNQIVSFHACGQGLSHLHPTGTMALVGILVHSFFDGVAIGSAFGAGGSETGTLVATAVFLHEVPEGAITVVILLHTGISRRRALGWGMLCAALTPIGTVVTLPFTAAFDAAVLSAMVGLSAGSFLYIAAANLLPETNRTAHRKNAVAFVLGVGVIIGLTRLAGNAHAHGPHAGHSHAHPHGPDPRLPSLPPGPGGRPAPGPTPAPGGD
jgi:zinc and cadmium transporter